MIKPASEPNGANLRGQSKRAGGVGKRACNASTELHSNSVFVSFTLTPKECRLRLCLWLSDLSRMNGGKIKKKQRLVIYSTACGNDGRRC